MGIIRQRRKAETKALLLEAGLTVVAERGIEFTTLDEVARTAGFTKGAVYRQFPSKGAFLLAVFEQYAAVARAGAGARQAPWFIPLDRKSTRLNSSYLVISYAVFCLKK